MVLQSLVVEYFVLLKLNIAVSVTARIVSSLRIHHVGIDLCNK